MPRNEFKSSSFVINANEKSVNIISDFYVPFEPKKSKIENRKNVIELRDRIKSSIEELVVAEDEILLASYFETNKNRFYDVENMLFFNIGTASFSNCCKNQVAFIGDEERFTQKNDFTSNKESKSTYSYKVIKTDEIYDLINQKNIIASWEDLDINLDIPQSAKRYYSTIRENAKSIIINKNVDKNFKLFGMKIDITLPTKNLPASIMKPLLDGLICAFHGEQGSVQETLNLMFGNSIGRKYGDCGNLNIFGKRQYVDIYRGADSYKWNPEDERLQFAWITVRKGEKAKMSGKIYEW